MACVIFASIQNLLLGFRNFDPGLELAITFIQRFEVWFMSCWPKYIWMGQTGPGRHPMNIVNTGHSGVRVYDQMQWMCRKCRFFFLCSTTIISTNVMVSGQLRTNKGAQSRGVGHWTSDISQTQPHAVIEELWGNPKWKFIEGVGREILNWLTYIYNSFVLKAHRGSHWRLGQLPRNNFDCQINLLREKVILQIKVFI